MRKKQTKPEQKTQANELFDFFGQFNPRTGESFLCEALSFEDIPEAIRHPFADAVANYVEYLELLADGQAALYRKLRESRKPISDPLASVLAKPNPATGRSGYEELADKMTANFA